MVATIKTEYTYPITDTANDQVNTGTLSDELNDAGLSVTVGTVRVSGSNIIIELIGDAVPADLALADAVIAAHQGDDYASLPIAHYEHETAETDDTGSAVEIVSFDSGPLHAGKHMIHWSGEIASTDATGTPGVKITVSLQREGQTEYNKGEATNDTPNWRHVTVPFIFHSAEGQRFTFRIYLQRTGSAGNPAKIRRARISLHRAQ